MGLSAPLILLLCSVGLSLAENDAYIIVRLEEPGRTLVKRQAQYQPQLQQQQPQYAGQPQQAQEQQISPDYLNYLQQLQQLSAQSQSQPAPQQQYNAPPQPPQYLQQSLQSTAPQSFLSQGPPVRPQIPEDQRILQESLARRPIINQEREDQRNRHLISLGIDPVTLRRQQAQEKIARQQAEQAAQAAARAHQSSAEEQLAAFFADAGPQQIVPQIQHYPIPQTIPVRQQQEEPSQQAAISPDQHQRVSYSQLSFGNPRPNLLRDSQQQLPYQAIQSAPQYAQQPLPQQQVSYEPTNELFAPKLVQQKAANKPQEKIIFHAPQQVTYIQPTEQGGQIPQQFLIETTKVQDQPNTVLIPKRVNYRPQADYKDIQASIAAQHQLAQLTRQQLEAATTPVPPSRSAIFVTTARTPTPKAYASFPEYRIPKNDKQRPLTQTELNALINAGFSVTPSPNQPEYQQFFRDLSKRQNIRPAVGRVSLSPEDRQALVKDGIRSLYRVQGAESRDAPVRYVLALDNLKRDTDKA